MLLSPSVHFKYNFHINLWSFNFRKASKLSQQIQELHPDHKEKGGKKHHFPSPVGTHWSAVRVCKLLKTQLEKAKKAFETTSFSEKPALLNDVLIFFAQQ